MVFRPTFFLFSCQTILPFNHLSRSTCHRLTRRSAKATPLLAFQLHKSCIRTRHLPVCRPYSHREPIASPLPLSPWTLKPTPIRVIHPTRLQLRTFLSWESNSDRLTAVGFSMCMKAGNTLYYHYSESRGNIFEVCLRYVIFLGRSITKSPFWQIKKQAGKVHALVLTQYECFYLPTSIYDLSQQLIPDESLHFSKLIIQILKQ